MEKHKLAAGNKRWEAMRLTYLGDIRDIVQGGEGKLTLTGDDPGESRKTKGLG